MDIDEGSYDTVGVAPAGNDEAVTSKPVVKSIVD
jgi:hypothetical protein